MKVKLLLLEGVEKEIEDEVKSKLNERETLSTYDKVLAEIDGRGEVNEQSTIFVDMSQFFKTTEFYFNKKDVKGLFMSKKLTKDKEKIMVIILDNQEYDCLFDEVIFEELKEFLNN